MFRRIGLFLLINALVVLSVSLLLRLLGVGHYLHAYGIDYKGLALFCLMWGMGGSLISLSLSRVLAKSMMRVNTLHPRIAEIRPLIETLSRKANLPETPEIGIFDSPDLNAFATGPTKRRSLIAVSTGLLDKMSPDEVEGVLAHEMAHIANGDMVTMTLLQGIVNAFVMFLARALAHLIASRSGNSRSRSHPYLLIFLFEIVFMALGSMVICAYSRFREYRADSGGASLASQGKMLSALRALEHHTNRQKIHESLRAMMISAPKKAHLFSTHPPLSARISRLSS